MFILNLFLILNLLLDLSQIKDAYGTRSLEITASTTTDNSRAWKCHFSLLNREQYPYYIWSPVPQNHHHKKQILNPKGQKTSKYLSSYLPFNQRRKITLDVALQTCTLFMPLPSSTYRVTPHIKTASTIPAKYVKPSLKTCHERLQKIILVGRKKKHRYYVHGAQALFKMTVAHLLT